MDDIPQRLRRAFWVRAAKRRFILFPGYGFTAARTDLGHFEHAAPAALRHRDDLRNNVARLANADRIADSDAELADDRLVVQRRP